MIVFSCFLGISIALMSYGDTIRIGVTVNKALSLDPGAVIGAIEHELICLQSLPSPVEV